MNSTVLNGVKIMKNCIVGAGAVVTEGKEFDEGSLIIGTPARAVRKLTDEEIDNIKDHAVRYAKLAKNDE
jgi:carbonic anhydrase/acetyltransferase-like protein (isoleucine patch superfamily)